MDEIVAQDILEHFPRARTQAILQEWRRVLRTGGRLHIRVPNMEVLARFLIDPSYTPQWRGHLESEDNIIENIYGGHRWGKDGRWDAHHWGWTKATMHRDLTLARFKVLHQDDMPNFYTYAEKA